MSSLKRFLFAAPAAILISSLGGCGSGGDQTASKPDDLAPPAALQAALQTPILDCQRAALDCRKNATEVTGRLACNDALAQCLGNAANSTQAIAQSADSCRSEGLACLRSGNDRSTCRDGYEACVDAALNGGADDAGSLPAPADSVIPSSPAEDGGLRPRLPGAGLSKVDAGALVANLPAPVKCTVELRICVAKDPSAAQQCADTARACLQLP